MGSSSPWRYTKFTVLNLRVVYVFVNLNLRFEFTAHDGLLHDVATKRACVWESDKRPCGLALLLLLLLLFCRFVCLGSMESIGTAVVAQAQDLACLGWSGVERPLDSGRR